MELGYIRTNIVTTSHLIILNKDKATKALSASRTWVSSERTYTVKDTQAT